MPEQSTIAEQLEAGLKLAEQGFAEMRSLADKYPDAFRTLMIQHNGTRYGVPAFLRLIRSSINFIDVVAKGGRP